MRKNSDNSYKTELCSYYERNDVDQRLYEEYLEDFLPDEIFDFHVHLGLPEHFGPISDERKLEEWALGVGYTLSVEAALFAYKELFPQQKVNILGFPFPIREAHLDENNNYIRGCVKEGKIEGLMATRPDWPVEKVRNELQGGCFSGIKPYPDFARRGKGQEVSIFDFLPNCHLKVVDELGKIVLLHIPRRNRLRDKNNIQEIKEIRQKYPAIKLIIAHLGRSYCSVFAKEGLRYFRNDPGIFFDTSAVLNPEVYRIALEEIGPDSLLFGSDFPITFMRGMREWHGEEYVNFTSGDYIWNTNRKSRQEEAKYTLFVYEQIKACRQALESTGLPGQTAHKIFSANAQLLLQSIKTS